MGDVRLHHLTVSFIPDWAAAGGGWFAAAPADSRGRSQSSPPPYVASIWRRLQSGNERPGLPDSCRDVATDLDRALDLLNVSYQPVHPDELDVTTGWRDETSRLSFLALTDEIEQELTQRLGTRWNVVVSRSPGITEIGLVGEYESDWPLSTRDGLGGPEDWPMLSAALKDRLREWAVTADPGDDRGADPQATDRLLEALRTELGDRFRVAGP